MDPFHAAFALNIPAEEIVINLMYSSLHAAFDEGSSTRSQQFVWSLGVAIIVHVAGLIGMVWGDPVWFSSKTPFNLLLMWLLLLINQQKRDTAFCLFMILGFFTGMFTEMIGVHTGILFGNYAYGTILGPSWKAVPFLMGLNWFVTVFIAAGTAQLILEHFMPNDSGMMRARIVKFLLIPLTGAAIATFFDWIMEPAAVSLGFWTWAGDGTIPMLNYISWFAISWLLLTAGMLLGMDVRNRFSIPLLLIQSSFFFLLRLFF